MCAVVLMVRMNNFPLVATHSVRIALNGTIGPPRRRSASFAKKMHSKFFKWCSAIFLGIGPFEFRRICIIPMHKFGLTVLSDFIARQYTLQLSPLRRCTYALLQFSDFVALVNISSYGDTHCGRNRICRSWFSSQDFGVRFTVIVRVYVFDRVWF